MLLNEPVKLSEALEQKQCRNCKSYCYKVLLNRNSVCPVCESGAQHLSNAFFHLSPVLDYEAREIIVRLLEREFRNV